MSSLEKAIEIAARAHAGQVDKGGEPYVLHVLRVVLAVEDPTARIAAALHDVVEDGHFLISDLRAQGFSEEVLAAVDALSRRKGEPYEEYVARIAEDRTATLVKLADLRDNVDESRLATIRVEDALRLRRRYDAALGVLSSKLELDASDARGRWEDEGGV
jgi:(p)ppGpp synthase/HD superfamily hydrolase